MDRVSATDVDLALLLADVATAAVLPFVADVVAPRVQGRRQPGQQGRLGGRGGDGDGADAASGPTTACCRRSPARWHRPPAGGAGCSTRSTARCSSWAAASSGARTSRSRSTAGSCSASSPARVDRTAGGRPPAGARSPSRTGRRRRDGSRSPCRPPTRSAAPASASTRWARPRLPRLLAAAGAEVVTSGSPRPRAGRGPARCGRGLPVRLPWDHAPAVALDPRGRRPIRRSERRRVLRLPRRRLRNAYLLDELLAVLSDAGVGLAGSAP